MLFHRDMVSVINTYTCVFVLDQAVKYFSYKTVLESCKNTSVGDRFSSVQSLSHVQLSATPCIEARRASLSITNSRSSLRLTSIESVMPSSHLILCHPFSSCLKSFPASGSFQMSQFFASGGQRTGASASVLAVTIRVDFL